MRSVFILTILFICLHSQAQNIFTQNRWSTNGVIGLNDFKFRNKPVDIVLDTLNQTYPYGYITEFLPDHQFISHNIGPCGNECRMIIRGTYTIDKDTIALFAKSLSYSKDCKNKPSEEINTPLGIYRWEQKDTRIILTPLIP